MKGNLIVIEGSDGTGKTTQSKLLLEYLNSKKIASAYISFPRYHQSMWADMVTRYLEGDFGKIDEVDPYLGSMLYAGDRLSAAGQIRKWLEAGKTVVLNRYVPSNLAHMGAKLKPEERRKYTNWLEKLEYEENGIPREDLVILLQVPLAVTRKLMKKRVLDIHEKNKPYQEEVHEVYDEIASSRENWVKIDCTEDGKIMKPVEINRKIVDVLKSKGIVQG